MHMTAPQGSNGNYSNEQWRVKVGLAEMLKGGVIMDVTNAEQARIAEEAGACAVMALERVPSDIRKEGGVARMASPKIIREIMNTVSIPVMAKVRIGHFLGGRGARSARGGLHRRERSADARRRGKSCLEA
jgi:pyridoxal 5'-phosphate synthase pdxS subunit